MYVYGGDFINVGYVRVSTLDQHEDRQIEALKCFNIEKLFIEKTSAKDMNRPELKKVLEFVRDGDSLYVHDFSRLARSTKDLLYIVETLTKKGVTLISQKENIDTSTPTGKLMLTLIGAISQFERDNLLERQREGIAIAKAKGKYTGGKAKEIKNFASYYDHYMKRDINKTELAKQLKISRPTLNKLIKNYEKSLKDKSI